MYAVVLRDKIDIGFQRFDEIWRNKGTTDHYLTNCLDKRDSFCWSSSLVS